MAYPGRAVRRRDPRGEVVRAVQQRLNQVGCGALDVDGVFGPETESSAKLFQTRRGLDPDGVVGPLTWDELFQEASLPNKQAPTPLLAAVVQAAVSQVGVREERNRPNRGAQIDRYVASVGLDPDGAFAWCQAFVYWCFHQAATSTGAANPCPRTAAVLKHWAASPAAARVQADSALDDPRLVRPGAVFIIDHGNGRGHTGLVTEVQSGEMRTIEGNTNLRGSREGDGVHDRTRAIATVNVGFIDYGRPA